MKEVNLTSGWHILQDVYDFGEEMQLFSPNWDAVLPGPQISEWEPLERLGHLQLIFAQNPYFGRELRYFNQAPWWYKHEFTITEDNALSDAALRFEGVDYFCKVWLNGTCLGEHEGYSSPFEFEVGGLLNYGSANTLVVKVWSPWDNEVLPGKDMGRLLTVVRDMAKGTYEHSDSLIQRDVNPVGIWGNVKILLHSGVRIDKKPVINALPSDDFSSAQVDISVPLIATKEFDEVTVRCYLYEQESGVKVACVEQNTTQLKKGRSDVKLKYNISKPKIWNTWDRGMPNLYNAVIEIYDQEVCLQRIKETFGIRKIEIARTPSETRYTLNNEAIFLRGITYFPDVYVSALYRERYLRDLKAAIALGCNAIRVHVHVEKPEFYDLCDELGLAVMQDSDLNWTHPVDEVWANRAVKIFEDMINDLRNHPSIITWVCMNEPDSWRMFLPLLGEDLPRSMMTQFPGPQLYHKAQEMDPGRPAIKGSQNDDPESGDSHNYIGSLYGEETHYLQIYGQGEKLNTEFGFDAPGNEHNLRKIPQLYTRLKPVIEENGLELLQNYQYRLLKFYLEHYRIMKYTPTSGYFHFMLIDLCPQSFYGLYDWWGMPKKGLAAFEESNQPVGIFLELTDKPVAIWAVNDLLSEYAGAQGEWLVTDNSGATVIKGSKIFDLVKDSAIRLCDLTFDIEAGKTYTVVLTLKDSKHNIIAKNKYSDTFTHPTHPKGHPMRISQEIGVRLYWA